MVIKSKKEGIPSILVWNGKAGWWLMQKCYKIGQKIIFFIFSVNNYKITFLQTQTKYTHLCCFMYEWLVQFKRNSATKSITGPA